MMNVRIVFSLLCALSFLGLRLGYAEDPVFKTGDHAAAYRTTKKMFFIANSEVIGKSSQVTSRIRLSAQKDSVSVEVRVPVNSFDSGNTSRDTHVAEILKGAEFPEIRFTSKFFPLNDFAKALSLGKLAVVGLLEVAGKSFPIEFPLAFVSENEFIIVKGTLATTFSAFGIEVPNVGPAGIIANPSESMEILIHLRADRVEGMAVVMDLM